MQNIIERKIDFNAMVAYDFGNGIGNNNCFSCDDRCPDEWDSPIFSKEFSADDAMTKFMTIFNINPKVFCKVSHRSEKNLFEIGKPLECDWINYSLHCKEKAWTKNYIQYLTHYANSAINTPHISAEHCIWKPIKNRSNSPLIEFYYIKLKPSLKTSQEFRDELENGTIVSKNQHNGLAKQMFDIINNYAKTHQI